MNRDDVIRMAREACDTYKVDAWHNDFWTLTQDELERLADLVAAAAKAEENEACAKLCEEEGLLWGQRYAAAIRLRSSEH